LFGIDYTFKHCARRKAVRTHNKCEMFKLTSYTKSAVFAHFVLILYNSLYRP